MSVLPYTATARFACPECVVLATNEDVCFVCGGPMVLAHKFRNPTSSPFSNQLLDLINGGSDAPD